MPDSPPSAKQSPAAAVKRIAAKSRSSGLGVNLQQLDGIDTAAELQRVDVWVIASGIHFALTCSENVADSF